MKLILIFFTFLVISTPICIYIETVIFKFPLKEAIIVGLAAGIGGGIGMAIRSYYYQKHKTPPAKF